MALREIFAAFSTSFDGSALTRGATMVNTMTQRVMAFGSVVMGGVLVRSLLRFTNQSADMARQVSRNARMLNMSADEFQGWAYAARQSGIEGETFTRAVERMARNAANAARGTGPARDEFRRLGIDVQDSSGNLLTASQLLTQVGEAAARMRTPAERSAAAVVLFGREGARLAPLLASGEEGIAALRAEFDRLGGGLPQELIDRSREYGRTMRSWQLASQSLRATWALAFIPTLQRVIETLTRWIAAFRRSEAAMMSVRRALQAVGILAVAVAARATLAWIASIAPLILAAAAVAVLYLAFDDLKSTLEGADTMLRRLVNETFPGMIGGLTTMDRILRSIRVAWDNLRDFWAGISGGGALIREDSGILGEQGEVSAAFRRGRSISTAIAGMPETTVGAREVGSATRFDIRRAAAERAGALPADVGRFAAGQRSFRVAPTTAAPTSIDARSTTTITVNGAEDPAAVQALVRRTVRDENERQIRQLRAATVPGVPR